MPKIFGQLEKAALEVLASDPSVGVTGRVFWNSTEGRIKIDDSAAIRGVLANDGKAVIGTSGTANNNIRFHRGANEVLQFVKGGDITAEGTLSTNLGQISAKFETYANTGALPAAGNAGRLVYQTDVALLKMDNGSAFKNLFSGLLTTKGDLFTFSTFDERLGVGTNGQVLTADSAEPTGLKWASVNPALNITSKTANYTATVSDDVILCDASGGAFTITLPPLSGILGRKILVIKTDTSFNQVTIDGDGAETINGFATRKLSTERERMELIADTTAWIGNRTIPSEQKTYSLVIGASTPPTEGSGATKTAVWQRLGDCIIIGFEFAQSAAGSAGSGTYNYPIPSGLTLAEPKTSAAAHFGDVYALDGSTEVDGFVRYNNTTSFTVALQNGTTYQNQSSGFYALSSSAIRIGFTAGPVKVDGWEA